MALLRPPTVSLDGLGSAGRAKYTPIDHPLSAPSTSSESSATYSVHSPETPEPPSAVKVAGGELGTGSGKVSESFSASKSAGPTVLQFSLPHMAPSVRDDSPSVPLKNRVPSKTSS